MDMKTDNRLSLAARPVGLIIRQKDPNNLEMPFDQLDEFITPPELFYIRSHFPKPDLDPRAYRLSIMGAVRNQLSLSYGDIRAMPSRTCVATLECAGNSRVFLAPPVPGAQWELGAVGNAEWTGVPLSCSWKAPDWPMTYATSFWKALIAACPRKGQGRRVRSLMPAVSRGRWRWNPTCSSPTR
jgi:Oxidoreductase molybdopterin binding domain